MCPLWILTNIFTHQSIDDQCPLYCHRGVRAAEPCSTYSGLHWRHVYHASIAEYSSTLVRALICRYVILQMLMRQARCICLLSYPPVSALCMCMYCCLPICFCITQLSADRLSSRKSSLEYCVALLQYVCASIAAQAYCEVLLEGSGGSRSLRSHGKWA